MGNGYYSTVIMGFKSGKMNFFYWFLISMRQTMQN